MTLTDIPLMSMLRDKMSWLNSRQSLLSQNVANADTPGYSAQDLKPIDFEQTLRDASRSSSGTLRVTDPRHIAMRSSTAGFEQQTQGQEVTDGKSNTVQLEEEMIKVADTQSQYQAAANIYSKAVSMMRTAIGH
ncbi:MAG TPA: flagellar basal body rod protein FlgB [Rhizomicrobium sp.]|nr:flagellar basal body rod protein FlgB [Rhizomicrobium sp.]